MIKLVVNNSVSRVEGLTREQHSKLRSVLSYTLNPQAAYFSGRFTKKTSLLDKKAQFPTGVLYLVQKYLNKEAPDHLKSDLRHLPAPRIDFPEMSVGYPPYPEQIAAVEAFRASGRGIIVAPTGVGKSLIVTLLINELKVRTLVVVPNLELKRQLSESLAKAFGDEHVGKGKTIWVDNVDGLDHSKVVEGYDAVILDEFHHSGAATYRKLNQRAWNGIYYRCGLTATPFRSQDNERILLESVLSQVAYRIEHSSAVEKGYIVPVEAYYYTLPLTKLTCPGTKWASVYQQLVVNNEYRNKLISSLMTSLHSSKVPTITLVKEIAHGEILSELTGAAFANGQDEDCSFLINAFTAGKLTSLIGTTGVLGEGVDSKPAEFIIIAGLGKSKNALMQQCGRGFRRYPGKESAKIIIFKDGSHKWSLNHFKEQVKIIKEEYGVVPVELSLPDL